MAIVERDIQKTLTRRLQETAPLLQVLVGPRQVGKTTAIIGAMAGHGVYQSADSPVPLRSSVLEQWWQQALDHPDRILAVDEIQKIPDWADALKKLWDTRPGLKAVVSGSAALLVEKGLHESLAGRFELIRAEHWGLDEAAAAFGTTLEQFVEFGAYPGAARFLNDVERWASYVRESIVEPILGRDLLQLHPVDRPAVLRQVFGVAISLPAQLVSLQKIQGELQNAKGTLPTISNYLRLLGDAFIVSAIRKYSPHQHHSRSSIPKLIVHDNALLRAFERPVTGRLAGSRLGCYFENAIGSRFVEAGWETWYWKDRDLEVDYVVLGPSGENWAIEAKSGEVGERDLRGLFAFCRKYPTFEPCVVRQHQGKPLHGVRELDVRQLLSLHRRL